MKVKKLTFLFNIANSQVIENLHLLYTYVLCLKENSMEKESSLLYTNVMCLKEKLMDETNSTRRSEKGVASKSKNFKRFSFHIIFMGH